MTRGNQRDSDRKKAQDKLAKSKTKNTMSGTEFSRQKELSDAIMKEKQRKADERKAAEAAANLSKKK